MGQHNPHWKKLKLACSTHRVYHHIELERGFPKPVAKVSEVFGRGFYGPWKIDWFPLGCQEKSADFLPDTYMIIPKTGIKPVLGGARTDCRSRADFLVSSAHKNLVRKVQALLRPVLESPAHRLYDGIPCWLVSSSLLVNYFIRSYKKKWKSPYILYGSGPDPSRKIYMQIWYQTLKNQN